MRSERTAGTAACSAAEAATGGRPSIGRPDDRRVDVVVIGSGVAGLSAAAEAAAHGARVVVFEAGERVGGASAMSGAACCIVGSPEQRALGIHDSVDLALADWIGFGGDTVDRAWARDYLEHSFRDVHQWCVEAGGSWDPPQRKEGNSVARWHPATGYGIGILDGIMRRLEHLDARIVTSAAVVRLLTDDDAVTGVVVEGHPSYGTVHADAVVVATGGFVNDRRMLERHSPRLRSLGRFLLGGSPTANGSGHRLLADAGSQFASMENIWIYPNGTPDPHDPDGDRGLGLRRVETELWINEAGERFHDESSDGGWSGTNAVLAQPGDHVWSVFDRSETMHLILIGNEHYSTPAGPRSEAIETLWNRTPHAVASDSIDDLAERCGLPVESLRRTVTTFNDALEAGLRHDPLTGRALAGKRPVGRNGFAALRLFPMAQKNFGGVRTDRAGRVLDRAGAVIPGLFAAGEVAGMAGGSINGRAGLEGTMFGPCLYSGRVVGRAIHLHRSPASTTATPLRREAS